DRGGAGARLGLLAAVNTVGAIAGAVAAPFVLVPTVGLWGGFLALAFLYALPAVLVRDVSRQSRALRDLALAGGWVAVLALANPLDLPETRLEPGERLVHQESRAAGLVAVIERDGERLIRIDNHYALGGTAERVHEERQGHLPLLLHASPDRVAFVGTATGISAGAALAHPVKRLHLVELVPGVASAARRFFHDANRGVYTDPRSHTVLDDARNFLRSTGTMFDVVVADLFVPWRSGTGSLYTQEHFEAVRARLHPGGLFCQWLPLYQLQEAEFRVVAATFHAVFPEAALFRGDFFGAFPIVALVGWRGRPPAAERVSENARALARAGETDRWIADPAGVGVWALYAGPLPAPDPATPRNRDDRPRIEFQAAKTHVGGRRGVAEPLVGLRWSAVQDELRLAARAGGVPFFPDLPAEARRAAEGGAALQLASGLLVAGRADEAARALTRAATLLPPHLLAAAPADPSAADLWHDLPIELDGR
ncbi:MAG: hypothetical protein O7A09_03845, partial [Proteobacteria bacterium]|nr:hypothetical protein [Pseudomonadota bacterium]